MERILAALCCITLMTSLWSGRVLSDQESAANNLDDKLDSAVAEIYNQDKKLIGTGTVVSLSGMILTAKHILEDPDVGGSSAASYLATVQVSFKGKKDYLDAELRAVHPFLDVAVLVLRGSKAPAVPAIPILTTTDGIKQGSQVRVIGHVQRTGELDKKQVGLIDDANRHGYIIAGFGVDQGTSGGPAIQNGKLLGVVRTSDARRTLVVPITLALPYLRLEGITFSNDGYGVQVDNIATIAEKTPRYAEVIQDLQQDVDWHLTLHKSTDQNTGSLSDELEIDVEYTKPLKNSQPSFDARVTIFAVPIFPDSNFKALEPAARRGFFRAEWLKESTGRAHFDNIYREIDRVVRESYGSLGVDAKSVAKVEIRAEIDSIVGQGYIDTPHSLSRCFSVVLPNPGNVTEPITTPGVHCGNEYDYVVDSALPHLSR